VEKGRESRSSERGKDALGSENGKNPQMTPHSFDREPPNDSNLSKSQGWSSRGFFDRAKEQNAR